MNNGLLELAVFPVLYGVVGSRAYGLGTEKSDWDYRGMYVASLVELLSFSQRPSEQHELKNPDVVVWELEKFMKLAAGGSPNVLEVLFLEEYLVQTSVGRTLVEARGAFLSQHVRKTYGGFATNQLREFKRAGNLEGPKSFKAVRHAFRLVAQGMELLTTGSMTVRVPNPEFYWGLEQEPVEELLARFEKALQEFETVESVLPETPDWATLDQLYYQLRTQTGKTNGN